MKTTLVTITLLFIGLTAKANDNATENKVETTSKTIVTKTNYNTSTARLYKFKNQKIKKELNFVTKKGKAKLA